MLELSLIQDTVTQIADAITAVLEIDTEIVDTNLLIVSGTGRFRKKVGTYEEYGEWEHGGYYRQMIETGEEQVCLDTKNHPFYNPMEGELSEITCPIIFEGNVVGLIGLIAFTEEQHQVLCTRTQVLCDYLRKMAELLASKLVESQSNIELAMLIDSAVSFRATRQEKNFLASGTMTWLTETSRLFSPMNGYSLKHARNQRLTLKSSTKETPFI